VCRDFLKYCFILDINKRVSIDELFHHPFVMINDLETIQKSQATSSHLVNSLTASRFQVGHIYDASVNGTASDVGKKASDDKASPKSFNYYENAKSF